VRETDREAVAISSMSSSRPSASVSSTPTLFKRRLHQPAALVVLPHHHPGHLGDIFKALRDDALLSKFSGGLGNDWTPVRALGSHIKGTTARARA